MNLTIRKAISQDIPTIVKFNCALAQETEEKELDVEVVTSGVKAMFTKDRGFYLVVESAGEVVAQLMITYEWSDWRNGVFWWFQSVYVTKDFRQQGIFRKMYDYVYRLCEENEVCGLRLYVDKTNTTAQKTYANLGMVASHYEFFEKDFVLGE